MTIIEEATVEIATEGDKPIYLKEHEEHYLFAPTTVVYMKNILGELEIRVCTICDYEDVVCLHIKNSKLVLRTPLGPKFTIECLLCGG